MEDTESASECVDNVHCADGFLFIYAFFLEFGEALTEEQLGVLHLRRPMALVKGASTTPDWANLLINCGNAPTYPAPNFAVATPHHPHKAL
jgi:hypothetical protein